MLTGNFQSSFSIFVSAAPRSLNMITIASIVAGVIAIIVLIVLGLAKAVKAKACAKGQFR